MKAYLIIDGYNIIYDWPVLQALKDQNLEHARDKLIEMMANYSAYRDIKVCIVFDGGRVKGNIGEIDQLFDVDVIFTEEGKTADAVIEKMVLQLSKEDYALAVATSDWAEQQIVMGKGARRYSAQELLYEVEKAQKSMSKKHLNTQGHSGREFLEYRLTEDLRKTMEKWRKEKR